MTRTPWMKFYPADWRADSALRQCSLAARAIWIEILGLMHEAEPYGHLLLNGKPPSIKALSGVLNVHHKTLIAGMKELERCGVYSRDENGVIYSRRMVRDHAKALKDKENGKRGGNPTLNPPEPPPDNPQVNGGDKAHIPEARSQKLEIVAAAEGARASGSETMALVDEALNLAKGVANLTSADVHHGRVFRQLFAADCTRDDILDAVTGLSAAYRERKRTFHSWAVIADAAQQNRDKRVAGLTAPAPIQAARRPQRESMSEIIDRVFAAEEAKRVAGG